ncbi:hypothetical protein [Candidatus Thioglobus autotrophicus]|uniref:hypothetical protein n=1 Tax=Candidatus Thioglobus autotrophicus TaxID=1705394 RepID=UPI00299EBFDE|nr:hypothetical protein [Candidatus Thioglobus autotrophicus]WPE18768.1 hypothetical protein R5P05_03925 [Candidatus Thioglobus autotrophicus]
MDYFQKFKGRFVGIMQLDDCDQLLQTLINTPNNWFVYDTLQPMPSKCLGADDFVKKIKQIKSIVDDEHDERYCGIVYADDVKKPTFVKIFHPKNLGKTCGSSENPPMPQWIISKEKPMDVVAEFGPKEESEGLISKYLKF